MGVLATESDAMWMCKLNVEAHNQMPMAMHYTSFCVVVASSAGTFGMGPIVPPLPVGYLLRDLTMGQQDNAVDKQVEGKPPEMRK